MSLQILKNKFHYNRNFSVLLCFFSLLLMSLVVSCTGARDNSSTTTLQDDYSVDSLEIPEVNEIKLSDSTALVNESLDTISYIDTILQKAHILSQQQYYDSANSYVIHATNLFLQWDENRVDSTDLDSIDILPQITKFYLEKLPIRYLDSIPESISDIIYQYQISKSLDSTFSEEMVKAQELMRQCEDASPYNIPIVQNERVLKTLSAILQQRKRSLGRVLARAEFYIPFVKEQLIKHDLPTDLAYLPILESGYNPKAYSYAHASGVWQFIPSTGQAYGMRRSYWIDERRDVLKSTDGAIRYLKRLYNLFDDWYLALAAYNCGEYGLERNIKKAGSDDFWDLSLPTQTMHYVPQFISYQIIAKNPQCFGFEYSQDKYFDYDTVSVSECLDLRKIARAVGTNYDNIKAINPHILHWCTPPNMENVNIYLPKNTRQRFVEYYKNLSPKDKIQWYRYKIKRGDNLLSLAKRFRAPVYAIKSINKLSSSRIIVGKHLYIPIPANGEYPTKQDYSQDYPSNKKKRNNKHQKISYKVSPNETLSEIAVAFNTTVKDISRWNRIRDPRRVKAGTTLTIYTEKNKTNPTHWISYSVQSGESLYTIAQKFGLKSKDIRTWNRVRDPRKIRAGSKLLLALNKRNSDNKVHNLKTHEVQSGESIYTIARKYGVLQDDLEVINQIKDPSKIRVGMSLLIPHSKTMVNRTKRKKQTENTQTSSLKKHIVKPGESLALIASSYGVSLASLQEVNRFNNPRTIRPGMEVYLPPKKQQREIKPPSGMTIYTIEKGEVLSTIAEKFHTTTENLLEVNNISNAAKIRQGQKIFVPQVHSQTVVPQKTILPRTGYSTYTVKSGESLYTIAQKLEVSTKDLIEWNGKDSKRPLIKPRDVLYYIPSKKQISQNAAREVIKNPSHCSTCIKYLVQKGDNISYLADLFSVPQAKIRKTNGLSQSQGLRIGQTIYIPDQTNRKQARKVIIYTVQNGDTLWDIATKFSTTIDNICKINNLSKKSVLKPGSKVRVIRNL